MASRKRAKKQKAQSLDGVRIVKPLAWLDVYLKRAKRKMPALELPRRIRSFVPRLDRKHRTWGACSITDRTITLATHQVEKVERKINGSRKKKKIKVLSQLSHREVLMTLAHELAHLEYPNHDYQQQWYALTIFNTFGLHDTCPHCNGRGKIPAKYENT